METVKHLKLKRIIGGLYIAFIIIMSLAPDPVMAKYDPTKQDILSHFTAYFLMMLWHARIYSAKHYPYLATIFILLGIVIEGLQGTMATREFQVIDIGFNAIGVVSAWLFSKLCLTPALSK